MSDLSVLWSLALTRRPSKKLRDWHAPHSHSRSSPRLAAHGEWKGWQRRTRKTGYFRGWCWLLCLALLDWHKRQKALLIGRLTESGCGFSYSHANQSNPHTHTHARAIWAYQFQKEKLLRKFACLPLWQSIHYKRQLTNFRNAKHSRKRTQLEAIKHLTPPLSPSLSLSFSRDSYLCLFFTLSYCLSQCKYARAHKIVRCWNVLQHQMMRLS